MKKTTTPIKTPSPHTGQSQETAEVGKINNSLIEFLAASFNMSWQLAIVVLVPIVGGFELDKKLGSLPALTIVGFILAMAGMALIVWRQLQRFTPPPSASKGRRS